MPPVSKRHHLKYIIQSSCDFIYEEVGGLDRKILHFSDNFNPFSGLNRPPPPLDILAARVGNWKYDCN